MRLSHKRVSAESRYTPDTYAVTRAIRERTVLHTKCLSVPPIRLTPPIVRTATRDCRVLLSLFYSNVLL